MTAVDTNLLVRFLTFDQAFIRKAVGVGHCRVAQPA